MDSQYEKYRGMRALLLTRVSTAPQDEMYGHSWQESQVRKLLIEPLGLQLDEEKHIIRDTYSGLEYRYRKALDEILIMAQNHEFEILVMEVLDRGLGRKALEREIFRMQLRELDIHILTTDPEDHADDDSFSGQLMRFIRGYKSQQEVADTVRRSRGGKIAKATGDKRRGIDPRVIGNGRRLYGYVYILDEKGKRVGQALNHTVIYKEPDGTKWTEVTVIVFIFESAANGVTAHRIARILNERGVPTPYVTMNIKDTRKKRRENETPIWYTSSIVQTLHQSDYWGERREFKTRSLGKIPGTKSYRTKNTPEEEQIIIAVPAIVSRELAMRALENVTTRNKQNAPRRNRNIEDTLLRSGYCICSQCKRVMTVRRDKRRGSIASYYCPNSRVRCKGRSILATEVDIPAWEEALNIIRDPSEVDQKVETLLKELDKEKNKRQDKKELTAIRKKQTAMRTELNTLIQEGRLDRGTREYLTGELSLLAKQEEDLLAKQKNEEEVQATYDKVQRKLLAFHKRCEAWREKLDDPQYTPTYQFMRDAIEFFGIRAMVHPVGSKPPFNIIIDPPSIVSIISRPPGHWR